MNSVRRARPWLGTLVDIRVDAMDEACAVRAIDAAFAEIATVHRLMSFHEAGSDLARLRHARTGECLRVNARTHEVLDWSLRIAQACDGAFDPCVATMQVALGVLPVPESSFVPDARASWRDIELLDGERVRLRRPLWIDLGGIAKGYAVDRAIEVLRAHGVAQACVNAGGDLRVCGPNPECADVRSADGVVFPAIELVDGALATSASSGAQHLYGRTREAVTAGITVSVAAPTCIVADALTKVVLAAGESVRTMLCVFDAYAWMHDSRHGWQSLRLAA
ncbi:MAG: FAD:protein FMN transferase [Proteobacteria bacterium]|nr:FAD:protein FMN transferase [Pseudomonadota bacterium]